MALDQQETFNQLVRQNNAMREALQRAIEKLSPWRHRGGVTLDVIEAAEAALSVQ